MVIEYVSDLEIEFKFYQLQNMMIDVGMAKGLAHPDTVKYSQELDLLMNHIQHIDSVMHEITR